MTSKMWKRYLANKEAAKQKPQVYRPPEPVKVEVAEEPKQEPDTSQEED